MLPNFYSLFKRGRYLRRGRIGAEVTDEEHSQAERFAVSAIGFTIHHDPVFRKHFINSICNLSFAYSDEPLDVRIEDEHWGDLVLKVQERAVAVIECKIRAQLQDNQNPVKPTFWDSGYGKKILEHPDLRNFPERRYIILGCPEKLALPSRPGITCHQKHWFDLENTCPDSQLANELLDCLGQLGVDTLLARRTNVMNIGEKAEAAAKAYAILLDTATMLDIPTSKWRLESVYGKGSGWCFGLDLRPSANPSRNDVLHRLQRLVRPEHSTGWFGYEGQESASKLTVWFYCSTEEAQKEIGERLRICGTPDEHVMKDGHFIGVFESAPLPKGDKEWFLSVIKAVTQ